MDGASECQTVRLFLSLQFTINPIHQSLPAFFISVPICCRPVTVQSQLIGIFILFDATNSYAR